MKHEPEDSDITLARGVQAAEPVSREFLFSSGDLTELIRRKDWSQTPLGPIETWPQSLRTTVSLCLASNFPINIIWGPGHVQIYNDGYRICCGDAHPRALGEDYAVTWASAWPAIGESFARACAGETVYLENQRMFLRRYGYLEETFFTFSHSPIRDESGGVGGLFHPVTETTTTILSERRTRALRDLSASLSSALDETEILVRAAEVLSRFEFDLPFLALYALDGAGGAYRLAAHRGVRPGSAAAPMSIDPACSDTWPVARSLGALTTVEVDDLSAILRGEACGPYEEPPHHGFAIPIVVPAAQHPPALLLTASSPRLPLTEDYRSFFELLSLTIAGALATMRALEDERRRAEALAEIDRAKTLFFSNVSHEFRTPLTLMLGPIEELLAGGRSGLSPAAGDQLEVVHSNSLRLLRLVNTLLDFSRMEAGRMRATFEPTDLAAFTAELASVFRAATERAGIALWVDCPPLSETVYVDREMWEKTVLNLVSNAFKFTFEGEIGVTLTTVKEFAELRVCDTGVGIPEKDLPHIFERFHRVPNARSRTHEGSGIGLALVRELVRIHGGSVHAASAPGKGSVFIVRIPLGSAHLQPEHVIETRGIASTSAGAAPFIQEALRWLPDRVPGEDPPAAFAPGEAQPGLPRLLVADDNADMCQYLERLLRGRYQVESVPDGEAALTAARERTPDLILSDVMMPRLDGIGLLRQLRADAALKTVPVILVSARAGEEAGIEGLQGGADDYLIKPFSARELLARVATHLELARIRKHSQDAVLESEARFRALVTATSDVVYQMSPDWTEMRRLVGREFIPDTALPTRNWIERYIHPKDRARVEAAIKEAIRTRSIFELEHQVLRVDGTLGWTHSRAIPMLDTNGEIVEWFGAASDTTPRKESVEALRLSEERFATTFSRSAAAMSLIRLSDGVYLEVNEAWTAVFGYDRADVVGRNSDLLGLWRNTNDRDAIYRTLRAGGSVHGEELTFQKASGEPCIVLLYAEITAIGGEQVVLSSGIDITARKEAEEALRGSEARLRRLAEAMPNLVWSCSAEGACDYLSPQWVEYTGIGEAEQLGMGWLEQGHPADRERVATEWAAAARRGSVFDCDFRIRRRDGMHRWFKTRAVPVRGDDGGIVKWFGSNTDIEDMRALQEALRASEARERARATELQAILDAAPVALFISQDRECRHVLGSSLTYEMLRLPAGANVSPPASGGQAPATFRAMRDGREIPPEDLPAQRAAATGQAVRSYEFDLVYEDGARRHLLGDAVPLFGEDGEPRGAVGALSISRSGSGRKSAFGRRKSWKASACWPEASLTISTICSVA